jgi:hypothetical protein
LAVLTTKDTKEHKVRTKQAILAILAMFSDQRSRTALPVTAQTKKSKGNARGHMQRDA